MKLFPQFKFIAVICALVVFSACDDDSVTPGVEAPATYSFERNSSTTVSFSGQTTRIAMGEELISELTDFDNFTKENLLEMFRNETASGGDADPFSDTDLNASTKSIKSKVAASTDFFATNTTEAAAIKADFETWIGNQVDEVAPNTGVAAEAGKAGQIADGTTVRYVSAEGLEYNQLVNKGLIGGLMVDQMLNNYLGTAVLDAGDNQANNDADVLEDGKNYTTMEHKWDEAYGYVYGASVDAANPNATIGEDDNFLNKYIARVEGDTDFAGIADEIYNAFKLGRAAIVAKNYTVRDEQAAIIREKISQIIAIRAIYYLQQGKNALSNTTPDYGAAFHDLSEGYGFIYSLRFTRNPNTNESYFTKAEVDGFLEDLLSDGANGLWNVEAATLDAISTAIAEKFSFTVEQAASTN